MVSSNNPIDADHHQHHIPHATADETANLLGGSSSSSRSSSASSRGSRRFGSVGFMIAFVVLSSSAFVFLMNKQQGTPFSSTDVISTIGEAQVLKEQAPGNVDLSPFTSHDNGLYYTYDGFSRGAGSPIFATDYADYVAEMETPLGKFISKNAENAGASILILGQHFQDADADKGT
mmetsp:Transcript_43595/g.44290  ORF Transcript_43595/g.44290 Transcript_43595/m.44290 type:complete len:176 (-) Transcript_43595:68-595(-)